jgi:predicted GNAT family acetyltransferase
MRVVEHTDPREYRDRAMPLLMQRECENCAIIGVTGRLAEGKSPTKTGESTVPLLLAVEDDAGRVIGAALQTPPHGLILAPCETAVARAIAEYLFERNWPGDEMTATVPTIRMIAEAWRALTNRPYSLRRALRVFRLDQVTDPPPLAGELRVATTEDLPLLAEWCVGFARDIGDDHPEDGAKMAKLVIDERRAHVWVDAAGKPRALCACSGPTPNGIRVNLVYTPPESRGRGYASNATAELSRRLLASGRKFCFLFTDAANPTSNSIYQKLGYRPVADFEHVRFE